MDTEVLASPIFQAAQNGQINIEDFDPEEKYWMIKYTHTQGAFALQHMRSKVMS